ncbi:MAG: helix-turn-helix transcriptional regulator [Verrucomicrobiota bacterium]
MAQEPNIKCDIRANFATAFRNWRAKNNIPLKKIAKDFGLAVSTVNSWELGKRFPTGENFQQLVNYTGVPPCRLFCVLAEKCMPAKCQLAALKLSSPPKAARST